MIDQLRETHLLVPCTDADAPAGTWELWPRWLGAALARRAVRRLASGGDGLGEAALAGDAGVAAALGELKETFVAARWDRVRTLLAADAATPPGVATIEATALALGFHLLDGHPVPRELAAETIGVLARVRSASGAGRLLPHGSGVTNPTAVVAAEWALGYRARSADPQFGPWSGEVDDLTTIQSLDDALDRWAKTALDEQVGEGRRAEFDTLARRVFRLGSWLFTARGLLPVPSDRAVWTFQVPALLLRLADEGSAALPGKTAAEIARAKAPDVDFEGESRRVAEWLEHPTPVEDTQGAQRAIFAAVTLKLAEDAPEARTRQQAIRDTVRGTSARFSLVKAEVEAQGGNFHDVLRWLWARWNELPNEGRSLPPIALLRRADLADARLVWQAAPAVVHPDIWRRASEIPALWEVLPAEGWRSWALAGNDGPAWEKMPIDVLCSLLDRPLPTDAFRAAWHRGGEQVTAWLLPRLSQEPADGPRRCLAATPSELVPPLLLRAGERLPRSWLQEVVTARQDGWRDAWRLISGG
ncbi:MAG: hypothetical protein Q8P18_03690 [Pseudomonadota bacterium]|nr:hypothetical protein [Pseudomonadota bacterium]